VLMPELCSRCGECATACPTGAVDPRRLDMPARTLRLAVADVIFATGFSELNPSPIAEYCPEGHPDIFTAMDFEAWTAEAAPRAGLVRRRSNGATPRSVAFIQCAGARDQRFLAYCASVCCMHALKQARWTKRRLPESSVGIFFTDLRAVGKGYETYARAAAKEGVLLVRSRPGLVFPLPEEGGGSTLAVRYEDTGTGEVITAEFDMVVLGGGLASCPLPGESRLARDPGLSCGFCQEPADVSQAVVQGSRAAAMAAVRLAGRSEVGS
ncbi:MAG: 4Fe-4S binding protein, partial [Syntrophobacteraceae bacterium]